jgi:transcriptional regulator with XRE-family HTH domain
MNPGFKWVMAMREIQQRQAELGRFLRARRLALQPEAVGIKPHVGRRRTPGLRREEVAERAGVSVSWYTWLEQGRDIHVSDAVLDSIAESLKLNAAQREYVHRLAHGPGTPPGNLRDADCLPPSVQRVLEAHEPNPGYAINVRFEIIGWNQAALAVFGDFSGLPVQERNVLRLLFTDFLGHRIVNWEPNASFLLGAFRASTSAYTHDAWFRELVRDLSQRSDEFRRWWAEYNVELRPIAYKELVHPVVGRMVLEQTALLLDDGSGRRLILYTPKPDTGTETKLRELAKQY